MSRPLPRYRQDTDPHKLDRIIPPDTDTPPPTHIRGARSGEGDAKRLRAIPVIAAGVPGTIPGTEGYTALQAKEQRRFKHHRLHRA